MRDTVSGVVVICPCLFRGELNHAASRQEKDMTDTQKLIDFLTSRSPFYENTSLHSIVTGVTADPTVNVECAKEVGNNILNNMLGKALLNILLRKKNKYCKNHGGSD